MKAPDKIPGQISGGGLPHHYEQPDLEPIYRSEFVWDIPDSVIVRDRNTAIAPAMLEPFLVASIRLKQVSVPLNREPGIRKNARKLLAEIPVGEIDQAHAAREKRTARSMSSTESS